MCERANAPFPAIPCRAKGVRASFPHYQVPPPTGQHLLYPPVGPPPPAFYQFSNHLHAVPVQTPPLPSRLPSNLPNMQLPPPHIPVVNQLAKPDMPLQNPAGMFPPPEFVAAPFRPNGPSEVDQAWFHLRNDMYRLCPPGPRPFNLSYPQMPGQRPGPSAIFNQPPMSSTVCQSASSQSSLSQVQPSELSSNWYQHQALENSSSGKTAESSLNDQSTVEKHDLPANSAQTTGSSSVDILQKILFNAGKDCRAASQSHSKKDQTVKEHSSRSSKHKCDGPARGTVDRHRQSYDRNSRTGDSANRRLDRSSSSSKHYGSQRDISCSSPHSKASRTALPDTPRSDILDSTGSSSSQSPVKRMHSPNSKQDIRGQSRSTSARHVSSKDKDVHGQTLNRYKSDKTFRSDDRRSRNYDRSPVRRNERSSSRQRNRSSERRRDYSSSRRRGRSSSSRDRDRSASKHQIRRSVDKRHSPSRRHLSGGAGKERNNTDPPAVAKPVELTDSITRLPNSQEPDKKQAIQALSERITEESRQDEEEDEIIEEEERIPDWIRCSPADLYFRRDRKTNLLTSTKRMQDLENKFESDLVRRAEKVRASKPLVELPPRRLFVRRSQSPATSTRDDKSGNESGSDIEDGEEQNWVDELNWRKQHPERLHEELWFNIPHEMNDGPLCRCSAHTLQYGVRHNLYPGEKVMAICDQDTNNPDRLYHYRITMSPHTNFLTKSPTLIEYDGHEYIFEGFSLFSHYKIDKVPLCKVIRFNIEYTIHYFEEDMVENFDVKSLDLFADFLYREILELFDLDWAGKDYSETCRRFHIMPRFSRDLSDNGKEILSMSEVLNYMVRSSKKLCEDSELSNLLSLDERDWQKFVDEVRGMIVTYPGKRPCSLRIDQLDREQKDSSVISFPKIVHFGVRPAQLSYAGDSTYQKLWKQYVRLKHLVANKPKVMLKDREKLRVLEEQLQDIRLKGTMKRETTVEISSEGFIRTGIKSDVCQHALLLPVLIQHLLFHKCLDLLEEHIGYTFQDRLLLQLALTHPSFRMNYGTNADHARNSLTNCGKRQLEYGDKRIHFIHTRKRGINTLMYIMSKMANTKETASEIHHYERLEFLGDAVIEFLSSIHLFFMFPRLEEGGLATYRAALVQNQHLSVLAEKMGLQHFMLYAHGPDLCHDLNIRHALANCFEALMGALFLDGGIDVADTVFGEALFKNEVELMYVWKNVPLHPLQDDEPNGDRHWIEHSQPLQNLVKFEESTGIVFKHIRLLARAFTMRNIGYNNLTLGHNQTLEFLGDTVLQLISSEYLFKHFPDHHEGHLTLLRSSLVNNRTQAIICDDLGMTEYVINNDQNVKERINNEHNKVKDKADIVEAFIGAMYVDQGLESCSVFCQVCFYPRLKEFIMNQDWNDAKSQLQQCCLTLRDTSAGEPDIPVYKVLQTIGPTNTRKYHVAVYFRGERLATGFGHSIQQAEMNTATNALKEKADLFPHLLHTKRFLDWRFSQMKEDDRDDDESVPDRPPSTANDRMRRPKSLQQPQRRRVGRGSASVAAAAVLKRKAMPRSYAAHTDAFSKVSPSKKRSFSSGNSRSRRTEFFDQEKRQKRLKRGDGVG